MDSLCSFLFSFPFFFFISSRSRGHSLDLRSFIRLIVLAGWSSWWLIGSFRLPVCWCVRPTVCPSFRPSVVRLSVSTTEPPKTIACYISVFQISSRFCSTYLSIFLTWDNQIITLELSWPNWLDYVFILQGEIRSWSNQLHFRLCSLFRRIMAVRNVWFANAQVRLSKSEWFLLELWVHLPGPWGCRQPYHCLSELASTGMGFGRCCAVLLHKKQRINRHR